MRLYLTATVMESSGSVGITPRNPLKSTDVLEEHIAVEEYAKQETTMTQVTSSAGGNMLLRNVG
jgi:hypothetical protein